MDTNVLANIHLFNLFMPQILKGKAKKVITISSGMGDMDMATKYDLDMSALYSTSKAAMNMIAAKFSAQYRKDGVLFLSICPGMVDVGHFDNGAISSHASQALTQLANLLFTATPEQVKAMGGMLEKFKAYSPNFQGPATPPDSIRDVMSVVRKCSVENGDGGAYLSHFGTKQWI